METDTHEEDMGGNSVKYCVNHNDITKVGIQVN